MKRILSLLLAIFLLAGIASAAFTDEAKISKNYLTAVAAMSEKGIITGFADGSFKPKDTLTRAQAAKIICTMKLGATAPTGKAAFADVPDSHWAAPFIGWCAEQNIAAGVGGGKFNPNGQLTAAAFAKMLLVAYGHDAEKDGLTGESWVMGTQKALRADGLNQGVTAANDPIEREMACQMAYNFLLNDEIQKADPAKYKEQTISFADGKNVKIYGRSEATDKGVQLMWPADAIEFKLDCKGSITLNYNSTETAYYTCFVDGVETANRIKITENGSSVLYRLIAPGMHTIRIVRDSEVNIKGTSSVLTGITVACDAATLAATPQNKLYIEAVGASVEAGCGSLGTTKDTWSSSFHAASKSYAYLAANLLGADYSIVAKGGMGLTTKSGDKVFTEIYDKVQPWLGDKTYGFARKPDLIICCVGGNDPKTADDNDQLYVDNTVAFCKLLREKNGADVKILLTYGAMHTKHEEGIQRAFEALGGEKNGYYLLKSIQGNNGVPAKAGASGHPSAADHAANAPLFADTIKQILNLK